MANTKVSTVFGSGSDKNILIHLHIISDGSEETALVVYDNSALVANVAKGRLVKAEAHGSDCILRLAWDQTTDYTVISMNPINGPVVDFKEKSRAGINPNGAGATGDLLLTTAGLDAGDEVSLFLLIDQS